MPCGSAKDSSHHSDKNGENGHCGFQDLDHSLLQHSLTLGLANVKQILKCYQTGSKEVKDLLLNECNIIYECKICANLFRSLANFLYHKRCYCKKHLCEDMRLFDNFEEAAPVVIVQPEPPDKDPVQVSKEVQTLPEIKECTVDLTKNGIADDDQELLPDDKMKTCLRKPKLSKEKAGKNKNNKTKEQTVDEETRSISPMVSRRTREKNKRAVKASNANEPPKKVSKLTKVIYNPKAFSEYALKQAKQKEADKLKESEESAKNTTAADPVPAADKKSAEDSKEVLKEASKDAVNKVNTENTKAQKKDNTMEIDEETTRRTNEVAKEITNQDVAKEMNKDINEEIMRKTNENVDEIHEEFAEEKKDKNSKEINKEINEVQKEENKVTKDVNKAVMKDVNKAVMKDVNKAVMKDVNKAVTKDANKAVTKDVNKTVTKDVNKEVPTDVNKEVVNDVNKGIVKDADKEVTKDINKEVLVEASKDIENKKTPNTSIKLVSSAVCSLPPKKMFIKPVKKIIIAKPPKSVDLPPGTVFDNFQKSQKIGFTNITNASKGLQCFPKIIFKTIDGNPHAVFQATENSKLDSAQSKGKVENPAIQNKPESEKLIIVLKKDAIAASPAETKSVTKPVIQQKVSKSSKNQTEFHLTRRKRLLARNDCSVQELKCLSCNARFTSIKTLYFHMLSIHSKKRLYFPCPFCKTLFVQMYGVTRHLISIHNKTKEQINKLRDSIKKKSIWKKVEEVHTMKEDDSRQKLPNILPNEENKMVDNLSGNSEGSGLKTVLKVGKSVPLHRCSKCNRGFERKSSQVSHEKFCIMNAIQLETVDMGGGPISPPPNMSFLSLSPKAATSESQFYKPIQQPSPVFKLNSRPKRGAEKQMHKDFVNSQTLKWRSANRIDTNVKTAAAIKKSPKNLEKKVANIMNTENLLCTKCDKRFSSYSNLRRHVAIHVGWTRFKCKYCEYQAYNKSQCWSHVQKTHEVPDNELDKSIINLGGNSFSKKLTRSSQSPKRASEVQVKGLPTKISDIPKVKIAKKKGAMQSYSKGNYAKSLSEKKHSFTVKKGTLDSKKEENKKEKNQAVEYKKDTLDQKREKVSGLTKDSAEVRREKILNLDGKKKEKNTNVERKKEVLETKKEKPQVQESKSPILEVKKQITPTFTSIFRPTVTSSSYKSVTTNNPTTIILSKKSSAPTVQSIMAISTESVSSSTSNKTFPLRSSPRNNESKGPEEKSFTTSLVTRSGAYAKPNSITLKMPMRSNSTEDVKKSVPQFPEKTYAKKDRLISEWFPKKDLNSNNARRESAPLIIGLVAASPGLSARAKNPAISYERSNS